MIALSMVLQARLACRPRLIDARSDEIESPLRRHGRAETPARHAAGTPSSRASTSFLPPSPYPPPLAGEGREGADVDGRDKCFVPPWLRLNMTGNRSGLA